MEACKYITLLQILLRRKKNDYRVQVSITSLNGDVIGTPKEYSLDAFSPGFGDEKILPEIAVGLSAYGLMKSQYNI